MQALKHASTAFTKHNDSNVPFQYSLSLLVFGNWKYQTRLANLNVSVFNKVNYWRSPLNKRPSVIMF
jgi:hypothetical protein